ncbi:hypothetical protein LY76DRAFT_601949 [Colletotrichum caudatum]|nr:hypothetical protein LY76DRAFT_601949 [Colletotrichum caudatum]
MFDPAQTAEFRLILLDYAGQGSWPDLSCFRHSAGQFLISTFEGPQKSEDWYSLGAKRAMKKNAADGLFSWGAWPEWPERPKGIRRFASGTDPRDHVLGILAHASDVERDGILLRDDMYSLPLFEKRSLAVLASAPQKVLPDAAYPWWCRPYVRWQKRRLPDLRLQEVEGRFCMALSEARVGDVICVLLGSEVPFVIRPRDGAMYEMTGEAYVSGTMDGEALSGKHDQVDIMLE